MERRCIENLVDAFVKKCPANEAKLKLVATMLNQCVWLLDGSGYDVVEGAAEDALQAALDTAAKAHIDIWNN